jgi:type I site-specific restriction endonuclease
MKSLALYQAITSRTQKTKSLSVSLTSDLIIIDECHGGSAADDAAGRNP